MTTERSITSLPDECLAHVFHFLSTADRTSCSAVCRRWLAVDGRTRRVISLSASPDLTDALPSILARFTSLSTVILHGERGAESVGDKALLVLARLCSNLTALHVRACHSLTDAGLAMFAATPAAPRLRELSFVYCGFSSAGLNPLFDRCAALESLTLESMTRSDDFEDIGTGRPAVASLRSITLAHFFTGNRYIPLIAAAKNLETLKVVKCSGNWDVGLAKFADTRRRRHSMVTDLHLAQLIIRDEGLRTVAACFPNLESLRLGNIPMCTDAGVGAIVKSCKRLRDMHIDGGFKPSIGGDGCLIAAAVFCQDLKSLKLVGGSPTVTGVDAVALKCAKLERLAVRRSRTFGDKEMACIGAKCEALKEISIKWWRSVTDKGLMELGRGCPRLEKVKLNKCPSITADGIDSVLALKGSSIVVARGDCH